MFSPYRSRQSYIGAVARTARNTAQSVLNKAAWVGAAGAARYAYPKNKSVRANPKPKSKKKAKKAPLARIQKQVTALQQQASTQQGSYTQKLMAYTTALTAQTNECDYASFSFNSLSSLSGVIDAVKYFNPAVPGTLVSVDMTSPTFQQQIRFTKSYGRLDVRNNYSVPCKATLYILKVKSDTSISPESAIAASAADETNTTIVDRLLFPTDCHEFNDLWQIVKSKTFYLQPGQEASMNHSFPVFNFDPALADDHSDTFQKRFHSGYGMVRVEGVLAHGSTSGMTHSKAGVDCSFVQIHTVKYPAGVSVQYLEIVDSPTTIVGTCQLSQLDSEQATYSL